MRKTSQHFNFISPLRCDNIFHKKTENGFNGFLYFPDSLHFFRPVRRPFANLHSKQKNQNLCILGGGGGGGGGGGLSDGS